MTASTDTNFAKKAGIDLVALQNHIRTVYTADDRPWVIGYSGGKDSTCALQLIWSAVRALPEGEASLRLELRHACRDASNCKLYR